MRTILVLIGLASTSNLWAQNQVGGPNGLVYQISATTHGGLTSPEPYQGWPQLCVRICEDCAGACPEEAIYSAGGAMPAQTDGGQGLQMAVARIAGLNVSRHIWVPSDGPENADGFVVYFDLLENPTAQDIVVSVRIGAVAPGRGQIRDQDATVWRTQSDDAVLEPTDRWFLVDDNDAFGGGPALAVVTHGAGARISVARLEQRQVDPAHLGALSWDFDRVRVPANSRVALVTVPSRNMTRRDTLEEVDSLIRMREVDVLFTMSDQHRRAVVNFDLDPDNASPVANAGGPYSADEGQPLDLSGVFSYDAESAELQYGWDFTDDGVDGFDDAQAANAQHIFPDNGVFYVRLRVTDEGGKFDIDRARIQIQNVPPRIDGISTSSPIEEGQALQIDVEASDPGDDTLTYVFDWDGDGQYDTDPSPNNRAEHVYRADGNYRGRVEVRDGDGGRVSSEFEVVVRNASPVINQVVAPPGVAEGARFEVRVIATDPGNDPMTFAYDLDGDGTFDRQGAGLDRIEVGYDDDGLYNLRVRVCDSQDACTVRETPINVGNIRPVIDDIQVTSPIDEGGRARIDVVATDVPGDSLTYAFDFDNDGDYADDIPGQAGASAEIPFADDGVFTVGVRVDDGDGGRSTETVEITVRNVAPTVVLMGAPSTRQGVEVPLTCQASDPGTDRLIYDWDFDGDGQFERLGARAEEPHTFLQSGRATIRCRVSDGDGGVTVAAHQIFVSNEIPSLELRVESPQNEGAEVVIRAVATDAGRDALQYTFDVDGDGEIDYGPTDNPIVRHVYTNQGQYVIRAVVDDGTDQNDAIARLRIVNVAPTIRLVADSPVDEGDEVTLSAEVSDPGRDPVTLRWDLDGDGAPDEGVEDVVDEPIILRVLQTVDDGRFNVTVWADDGDGGVSQAAAAVVIRNLPPSFPDGYRPPDAHEGQPYNRAIPASDPVGVNDPIRYSLLEPPAGVDIEEQTGLILWTPTYRDFVNRPIVLRVRIDDGDGGSHQQDIPFDVIPIDADQDGLPDTYESMTCSPDGVCLDPTDPSDADDDPDQDGRDNRREWAEGTDPHTYEGPDATRLLAPGDGDRVATFTPDLVAGRVEDDRDTAIFIEFEVYGDPGLEQELVVSGPVLQPNDGDTTWTVPEGSLEEDVWYWWRARASTEGVVTPWVQPFRFRTNTENAPPTSPTLLGPPDGARIDTLQPTLRASQSMDPDEDTLRYVFRVYDPMGEIFTTGEGRQVDSEIHFQTPALIENTRMTWDIVAIDEASAESPPVEPWSVYVDTENSVPSVPTLLAPLDDEVLTEYRPTLRTEGSTDEDGDAISYVFSIRSAAGMPIESSEPIPEADGAPQEWQPTEELAEDGAYVAAVHAVDARGGVSEEASVNFFVSAENEPPPVPEHLSPASGAQVHGDDAILVWSGVQDPEGGAVTYVVEVCAGEECTRSMPQTETSFSMVEEATDGTTYSWRVEAMDPEGVSAGPTEPWRFSVFSTGAADAPAKEGCACDLGPGGIPTDPISPLAWLSIILLWRYRTRSV